MPIPPLPGDHPCRADGSQVSHGLSEPLMGTLVTEVGGDITQMSLEAGVALPHGRGTEGTEGFVQVPGNLCRDLQPLEGQRSVLGCGKNTRNGEEMGKKRAKREENPLGEGFHHTA